MPKARDKQTAAQLWETAETLTGVHFLSEHEAAVLA
jgi:hypothetical protein